MYSPPRSLRSDSELPACCLSSPCPLPFRLWPSDTGFELPSCLRSTDNRRLPLSSFVPPRASPHLASIRFLPLRVYRQALRSLREGVQVRSSKPYPLRCLLISGICPATYTQVPSNRTSGTRTSTSMSEACGVGNGALDEVPLLWWDVSPRLLAV